MQTIRRQISASCLMGARRWLNIHEADSYEVLNANGVKTPRAKVAYTATEAKTVAAELGMSVQTAGTSKYVVKAQVLAGGRGKGHFENGFQGGVHIVDSLNEVADVASKMIGHKLITKQTGEEGRPCNKIMVAEPVDITHEYYLALLLDRKAGNIAMIGSREGGMNIEETAAKNPDAIKKVAINIAAGMSEADAQSMSDALGFQGSLAVQAKDQFLKLYETMINCDATQIEINPMVTTSDHRLNGAGLAMATMDMLHHEGGQAANFLDVGGSANTKTITAAFGIITTDPKVKAIFVNIFGGIMSCKTIAEGMVGALANVEVKIPIVVRLMGTHMEEGAAVLASYKGSTPVIPCIDFDEAARKASRA